MNWRSVAGGVAVAVVLGLCGGVLASVLTANDLLTGSAQATPTVATLAVVALGLLVAVFLAGPSRGWLSNPYW